MRKISSVVDAVRTVEGEGFVVRRPFPTFGFEVFDPFLLLDHMGPQTYAPGEAKGAPDHPHRGFETVTYMIEGEFEHADSVGNRGTMHAGDAQWMTAGAGVVHSEMPSELIQNQGGTVHGLQLWVNLPAASKMIPPKYQDVRSADIPVVSLEGGSVRVIAGTFGDVVGPATTFTPINYLRVSSKPGGAIAIPVPDSHNVGAYVVENEVELSGQMLSEGQFAIFEPTEGDGVSEIQLIGGEQSAEVMILTGQPLRETVARYGPFVMNTREEIVQAFDDFQSGKMGAIQ